MPPDNSGGMMALVGGRRGRERWTAGIGSVSTLTAAAWGGVLGLATLSAAAWVYEATGKPGLALVAAVAAFLAAALVLVLVVLGLGRPSGER